MLCARHCVNCITCINLFDYFINCLLKEYTEAFFFFLAQCWFQRKLVWKEVKYDMAGENQLNSQRYSYKKPENRLKVWCRSLGSVHVCCFDLVPQNDSYFRLKWTDLFIFSFWNENDWRKSPRLCSGPKYVSQPLRWRVAFIVQQGPLC